MPKVPQLLYELYNEDCLQVLPRLPVGSVDLVLADPPYGTTDCKWDSIIPLEAMWKELERVVKANVALVFMATQPFGSSLIASNLQSFRHEWIWDKRFAANFVLAKYQPLKRHESVLVFSKDPVRYFPQKSIREVPIKLTKNVAKYGSVNLAYARQEYNNKEYKDKCPESILFFSNRAEGQKNKVHPTQKPVALMEYLIKTYTNEGDLVLDFAMGSGTTGVACGNLSRRFIGIDNDKEHGYFEIAERRIREAYKGRRYARY